MTDFSPRRFQVLPVLVKNLIIINAIILLLDTVLQKSFDVNLADYLGLHYWKSHYFKPWQLITHMFMHGDFMHLFFNMFALWMFGSMMENIWGPKRFLVFYLVCGLGGALCHMAVLGFEFSAIERAFTLFQQNPTVDQFARFLAQYGANPPSEKLNLLLKYWEANPSDPAFPNQASLMINQYLHGGYNPVMKQYNPGLFDQATVGASGAVFGILFAFGYLFPNTSLFIIPIPFPVKAKYFVGFYALAELFAGFQNSAGDNVAHFAHLGGMLFAFLLLKYWNIRSRNTFY